VEPFAEDARTPGSNAAHVHELCRAARGGVLQLPQERVGPGACDRGDLFGQVLTDARNLPQSARCVEEVRDALRPALDGTRCVAVRPYPEGIFLLQLEEVRDLTEDPRDLCVAHALGC
jgi:hypothetical protein